MTVRQRKLTMIRRSRGFSMIDVLVAIVVLATGLLALAALQGALTRNGSDARARSQIAAYTQSIIDRMRFAGYDAVVPGTVTSGQTISPGTCTGTLTLAQQMACDAKTAQTAAGVGNLQTTITGTEWWGSGAGGAFTTTAPTITAGVANYKQVNVTSTWTDATGAARSVSFDTTVSQQTVTPGDSTLNNKVFVLPTGNSPTVRQVSPAATAGVIPIAVSQSQNAAATNPAPLVTNLGTTFSTITYNSSASALGGNVITERIDTKVLRCTCKFIASGGVVSTDSNLIGVFTQPYGPTYWDGTQYVTPTALSSPTSTTGVDPNSTQDSDCDICCRDRNDVSGNAVLFDNYSNGDFAKYRYVSNVLTAVTSGTFAQTCRMIRVDGVYSAATDVRNYFFGMLDTEPCTTATAANSPTDPVTSTTCTSSNPESSAVPTTTATTNYQSFVTDYLYNNLSTLKGSTGVPSYAPSDPQAGDTPAGIYNTTYSLNTPTSITIAQTSDTRFQHARGLYIDHLESKAQTALTNAIASCSASDETSIVNCGVFSVLPFTTVNMTELADWTASAPSVITTPSNASVGGVGKNPSRGYVYSASATANGTVNNITTVNQLNSGLTGITSQAATTQTDSTLNLLDQRQYIVGNGGSGGGGGGGPSVYFDVVLSGLDWMGSQSNKSLDPSVAWTATAAQMGTAVASTNTVSNLTGASPNLVVTYAGTSQTVLINCNSHGNNCTPVTTYYPIAASPTSPVTAPVGLTVTVQAFNKCLGLRADGTPCAAGGTGGAPDSGMCTNSFGGSDQPFSNSNATQCFNYQVDTANVKINLATVTGATSTVLSGTTDGGQLEGAAVTLPSTPGISSTTNTTAGADLVTIPFTLQSTTVKPGTCVCTSKACTANNNKQQYIPGRCPD